MFTIPYMTEMRLEGIGIAYVGNESGNYLKAIPEVKIEIKQTQILRL